MPLTVKPDYNTARREAGFSRQARGGCEALPALAGIPIREFNLNPQAAIDAYRRGWPLHRELFGPDVTLPGLSTPPISYGHVNGLGAELIFPEGGAVGHTHIYASLAEGRAALKQPVDFSRAGLAPFYLDFRRKLQEAFPDQSVQFGYGLEGPITTAWELRGEGLFTDFYDDPEKTRQFLSLTTASILEFYRFRCRVDGIPAGNPNGCGMADDIASMVPPALFEEFVLPYWEEYFSGQTTGKRSAHIEDLRTEQLPFLETIGLSHYDPSISPKLTPALIAAHCRVPFVWRLGGFHYWALTEREVEDVVYRAAAEGASGVSTTTEPCMCNEATARKVKAFVHAAKETQRLLAEGISREAIGQKVSVSGRLKLWKVLMK